jgi:hypothetical protein
MAVRGEAPPGLSGRAWSAALVALGVLLFTWPFVRTPPLGLVDSYLHLLGAWAALIAATAATARALRRGGADA